MGVDDLRSLYLSELQEICDCEAQTVEELPVLAGLAGSAELRLTIGQHAHQTAQHGRRIETILRRHGWTPRPGFDQVAAALMGKAKQVACGLSDPDLRDAAMIAAARRIAHHQIAAYSAAQGYAEALHLAIDRHSLLAILQEEQSTDRRLANLQNGANQLAFLVSPLCH